MSDPIDDPRRLAIAAIVRIDDEGAYANVVLPKMLGDTTMEARDKGFATELVYGSTRMKRRLDHLVDRFLLEPPPASARAAKRTARKAPSTKASRLVAWWRNSMYSPAAPNNTV